MTLEFLPFEEAKTNPMLGHLPQVRRQGQGQRLLGVRMGRRARVRQAVDSTVKKDGVNGLTRANLIDGIDVASPTSMPAACSARPTSGQRIPTPCFLMEQLKNDKFVRVVPAKKGTFDCKAANSVKIKAT